MAFYADLYIDQGANFSGTLTIRDEDNEPVSLAGYTVRGSMRRSYIATTATAFTIQILDANGGVIKVLLNATQTAALRPGRYVYDVEIENISSGEVTRVIEGTIVVSPEVTKP